MPKTTDAEATLWAQANTYLGALEEPYAGLLIHQILDPDALVLHRGAAHRAGELEARDFAIAWGAGHEVAASLGHAPGPTLKALATESLRLDEEGQALQWLRAEDGEGRPWALALGWRWRGDRWRLLWHTMAAEAHGWSFQEGLAQSLAEQFFPLGMGQVGVRSAFDWAWLRLQGLPDPTWRQLPEARFSCQGSGGCCSGGFTIEVPRGTQALLDALPWGPEDLPAQGLSLPPGQHPDRLLLKDADQACRFLTPQGHCKVHAKLGRQTIPVCATFPYQFVHTPEGVDLSLHVACPTVRGGQCSTPPERLAQDLRERLALSSALRVPEDGLELAEGLRLSWPAYQALEAELLAALQGPGGLADRLWAAHRCVEAACGRHDLPPNRPLSLGPLHEEAWRTFLLTRPSDGPPAPSQPWLDAPGPLADQIARWLRAFLFSKHALLLHTNLRGTLAAATWYAFWLQAWASLEPSGQAPEGPTELLGKRLLGADPFVVMPKGQALRAEAEAGQLTEWWLALPRQVGA